MSNYRVTEPYETDEFFRTGGVWSARKSIYIESPTVPAQTVEAFIDDDGTIKSRRLDKTINRIMNTIEYESDKEQLVKFIAARAIQIIYILFVIYFAVSHDWHYTVAISVFTVLLFFSKAFTNIPKWIINTFVYGLTGIHSEVKKIHAAEHKAMKAFRRYGHVPTFEEVKKMQKRSVNCGTNEPPYYSIVGLLNSAVITVLIMMIISAIEGLVIYFTGRRLFITILIFFMALYLISRTSDVFSSLVNIGFNKNILTVFQLPFLGNPTDREINLSIAAVKAYTEMEEELKTNMDSYEVLRTTIDNEKRVMFIHYKNGKIAEYDFDDLGEDIGEVQVAIIAEKGDKKDEK